MLVTECRIDLFLENLDTGRLRRNAEGGIIGKRLRIEILGSPDESDVIIDSDASRCTIFTENGIVRGAVLINSKALMMKVKNAIGKPFSESFPDYS